MDKSDFKSYNPADFGFENTLHFCTYRINDKYFGQVETSPNLFRIKTFETEEEAKNWVIKQMSPRTKGMNINNTSGIRGVRLGTSNGLPVWIATIKVGGKEYKTQFSPRVHKNAKELAKSWRERKEKEFGIKI